MSAPATRPPERAEPHSSQAYVPEAPPAGERGQRAEMIGILVSMVLAQLSAKQEQADA